MDTIKDDLRSQLQRIAQSKKQKDIDSNGIINILTLTRSRLFDNHFGKRCKPLKKI